MSKTVNLANRASKYDKVSGQDSIANNETFLVFRENSHCYNRKLFGCHIPNSFEKSLSLYMYTNISKVSTEMTPRTIDNVIVRDDTDLAL